MSYVYKPFTLWPYHTCIQVYKTMFRQLDKHPHFNVLERDACIAAGVPIVNIPASMETLFEPPQTTKTANMNTVFDFIVRPAPAASAAAPHWRVTSHIPADYVPPTRAEVRQNAAPAAEVAAEVVAEVAAEVVAEPVAAVAPVPATEPTNQVAELTARIATLEARLSHLINIVANRM